MRAILLNIHPKIRRSFALQTTILTVSCDDSYHVPSKEGREYEWLRTNPSRHPSRGNTGVTQAIPAAKDSTGTAVPDIKSVPQDQHWTYLLRLPSEAA